jgi:hypothetical protein
MVGESAPALKNFFVNELDSLLKYYEPGLPKMKPDVIKQTEELEKNMAAIMQQQQQEASSGGTIIMHQEGKEPVALTNDQVINIIQVQQAQVKELTAKVAELQGERDKLERSLLYITTRNIELGENNENDNDGKSCENKSLPNSKTTQLQKMLSNCLSDLSERDETLRKLKGLYMKSIVEASELKTQISELKRNVQPTQQFQHKNQDIELSAPLTGSEPIRLIIEESEQGV